ncbi:MAG: hypothetical protein AB8H79_02480, partial [Myxococcota bacterium]
DLVEGLDGDLWLATEASGLIQWNGDDLRQMMAAEPGLRAPPVHQVSISRAGHLWVRRGSERWVLPGPTAQLKRWPWAHSASSRAARGVEPR